MNLVQPIWLLLIIPAALLTWSCRMPGRSMLVLRIITYLCVILAIAGLRLKLPGTDGITVVIADRSASMPRDAEQSQKEAIGIIADEMGRDHQLAVVSFAGHAAVEQPPAHAAFPGFQNRINPHNSALGDALAKAQQLIPHTTPGRILLLSDGQWNGVDPSTEALNCAARGIAIDYRSMQRPAAGDLHVHQISAPRSVPAGQGFYISAWIGTPGKSEVSYQLSRNGQPISSGVRRFTRGLHKITFRDRAVRSRTDDYLLTIASDEADPIPENNSARFLVSTLDKPALLLVSQTAGEGLKRHLAGSGLEINRVPPSPDALELTSLAGMRTVILENVPASQLSERGMTNLRQWIETGGRGLFITGGKQSFGAGGYFKSPLDPILPVSMELRKEHRKFAMAIVVVLDRSGSMSMPVAGGKTKMDLANMGTVQVLDLMSDMDEIGVIAVDSEPHEILDITSAAEARELRNRILGIESMGGGIFVYEGLKAAVDMLRDASAKTRHIILFADAADAEEPGDYKNLLEECRQDNISCSVVALGSNADTDALLLEDIARRGGGRSLFTVDPAALPRLFAQDTFAVARSTFLDEPTPVRHTPGWSLMSGARPADDTLTIGGYNLCYLRDGAFLGAMTIDTYKAPAIAGWNVGPGRVAAYTGEADGEFTGPVAASPEYGDILTSVTRWCAGEFNPLPDGMMLRTLIRDGACRVELHLDPDRESTRLPAPPTVSLLRSTDDTPAVKEELTMRWQTADMLAAETPLVGREVVLPVVSIAGQSPQPQPPVTLPFSAEFAPQQAGRGIEALKALADMTGGTERLRLNGIWETLPRRYTFKSLRPWLLLLAIVLFLLEIALRRGALPKRFIPAEPEGDTAPPVGTGRPERMTGRKGPPSESPKDQAAQATEQPEADANAASAALHKAAARSKERLRR